MQVADVVTFEARIYLDGILVSAVVLAQHNTWPYVVEETTLVDKDGNPAPLRFPPFHQEILHQSHWDAGELLGRIRVVIAEGFARPNRAHPFERVRDVLAFSFQHAPLRKFKVLSLEPAEQGSDVLEFSGVAWPNPGMWRSLPHAAGSTRRTGLDDLHAHSPSKNKAERIPRPPLPDPFYEPTRADKKLTTAFYGGGKRRSTIEDTPMPDYPSATRSMSSMTGVSLEAKANQTNHSDAFRAAANDPIMSALAQDVANLPSPSKDDPHPDPKTSSSRVPSGNKPTRIASAGSSRNPAPRSAGEEDVSPLLQSENAMDRKGGKKRVRSEKSDVETPGVDAGGSGKRMENGTPLRKVSKVAAVLVEDFEDGGGADLSGWS